MSRTIGLLLASCAFLSACVSVSTRMMSADTALISASNDEASPAESRRAALLAAARMASERGFEYFGVVEAHEGGALSFTFLPGKIPDLAGNGLAPLGMISADGVRNEVRTELTVRFLHAGDLPPNRDDIYEVAGLLAKRKRGAE